MGNSASAQLAYGYDLGSDNNGWKIKEADRWGTPNVEWFDDEMQETRGFAEVLVYRLAEAGVDGVELDSYGYEYEGNMLIVKGDCSANWGEAERVDFASLTARLGCGPGEANQRLAAAVAALGITPTQGKPSWLLTASYG